MIPSVGSSPTVGLSPTTPLKLAGQMIEPSVSVPTASGTTPTETAAAEPDEDPPALRCGSQGLRVRPPLALQPLVECGDRRLAHSLMFDLPSTTRPASRKRLTSVASCRGRVLVSAKEPAVVRRPSEVSMLSFRAMASPVQRAAGVAVAGFGVALHRDRHGIRIDLDHGAELWAAVVDRPSSREVVVDLLGG